MFSEDRETFKALNALSSVVERGGKPLIVWLGAGASAWAGYPLWQTLAETMHRRFAREMDTYEKCKRRNYWHQRPFRNFFRRCVLAILQSIFLVWWTRLPIAHRRLSICDC